MKCRRCIYFEPLRDAACLNEEEMGRSFGHCSRWHHGASVSETTVRRDEAWVEDREGWGNVVGIDFGCSLFESAEIAVAPVEPDDEGLLR